MLGRLAEWSLVNLESIQRAERILTLNPRDVRTLSLGSGALQAAGQFERGREWAERALEMDPADRGALTSAACLHSRLGNVDLAIGLLERAFGLGWGKRDWIEHDSDYDPLRGDQRFKTLLAKLK